VKRSPKTKKAKYRLVRERLHKGFTKTPTKGRKDTKEPKNKRREGRRRVGKDQAREGRGGLPEQDQNVENKVVSNSDYSVKKMHVKPQVVIQEAEKELDNGTK